MDMAAVVPRRSAGTLFTQGLRDLVAGLKAWRVWTVLAVTDVRQRYRQSRIGQFWITISMGATIVGVGLVFGSIMDQPFGSYLPFLGIGLIVWAFLATTTSELTVAFVTSRPGRMTMCGNGRFCFVIRL